MNSPGKYRQVVIIGCGDIGKRTAMHWLERGYEVTGVVRSPNDADELDSLGITPVVANLDDSGPHSMPDTMDSLLYYFVPPPREGVTDRRLQSFLNIISPKNRPARVIYISTTGVYGDTGGAWVTEESAVNPQTDRSKRRGDAEQRLMGWAREQDVPYNILRVPGIYGPGRIRPERVRNREPVIRKEDAPFSNRIHAADLAAICEVTALKGQADTIYNASDGHPVSTEEFYNIMADLMLLPPPPAISLTEARERMSSLRLSFIEESRRVDNSRLRKDLGYQYRYPTVHSGLKSTLEEMDLLGR